MKINSNSHLPACYIALHCSCLTISDIMHSLNDMNDIKKEDCFNRNNETSSAGCVAINRTHNKLGGAELFLHVHVVTSSDAQLFDTFQSNLFVYWLFFFMQLAL